ncbi:MAG: hypothetical protein SGI74_12480 [Oligoflexia bacterium]|nr:hypothetical protein [Oligoflexia bacterium]
MKSVMLSSLLFIALGTSGCQNAGVQSGDAPRIDQYGSHGVFTPTRNYLTKDDRKGSLFKGYFTSGCERVTEDSPIDSFDVRVTAGMKYNQLERILSSDQKIQSYETMFVVEEAIGQNSWRGKGVVLSSSLAGLPVNTEFQRQSSIRSYSSNNLIGESVSNNSISWTEGIVIVKPESVKPENAKPDTITQPENAAGLNTKSAGELPSLLSTVGGPTCKAVMPQMKYSEDDDNEYTEADSLQYQQIRAYNKEHHKVVYQDGTYQFANGQVVLARRKLDLYTNVPLNCNGSSVGTGNIVRVRITSNEIASVSKRFCGGTEIFKRDLSIVAKGPTDRSPILSDLSSEMLSFTK